MKFATRGSDFGSGRGLPHKARALGHSLCAGIGIALIAAAAIPHGGGARAQEAGQREGAAARRTLVAVVPASWKPQYDLDEQGRPIGFAIDVMNEIAARAGVTVTYRVAGSFPDAVDILDSGDADLIPNSRIRANRLEKYAFSVPVETYSISIFVRAGNRDIRGEADLPGRRLGVVKSHIGARLFRDNAGISLVTLPDLRTGVEQLTEGLIDALVYSEPALVNAARSLGVDRDIVAVGEPLRTIRRGIRVKKRDAALVARLDPAIKAFLATPEYRRLYEKWFLGPTLYWTRSRIAWVMGAALAASVIAMAGWRYASLAGLNRNLSSTIAHRVAAEREAGEKSALFESAIANMGQGFDIFDSDHRLLAFNNQYVDMMGYPPGFLRVGMSLEEIIRFRVERGDYGETDSVDELVRHRLYEIDREMERTRERTLADGTTFVFHRKPLPGGGFVSTFTDITAAKAAEAALRESETLLRQAQKMEAIGQLTGGIAHDFNNLLMVIQGNAELLAARIGGGRDELLQPILHATERGAELTQRLLAFSRQQALRPRAIDLAALVAGMDGLLKSTLGETVEIGMAVAPELWPAMADASQVENALLNLAINARDAMPRGGRLTIECANARLDEAYTANNPEARAGDYVMLAVSDTGCGMTPDVASRAFEPFFTTKQAGEGSGLGLSMVHGFAQQSGGHVSIGSEAGRGTTVRLYLPRATAAPTAAGDAESAALPLGAGETVLVVEDDQEVRGLAVVMLKGLGYQVFDVVDADAALGFLANGDTVDLILSDVVLPGGMSGPEFADRARAAYPALRIMFMSGYPADAARRKDFPGEADILLNKPFQTAALARAVRSALA